MKLLLIIEFFYYYYFLFYFFFLKEITLPSIFHRIWQHISQILHPFRLLLLRTPQQSLQHAFFFFFFFFFGSIKMKKWTDFPQTLSPILIIFTPASVPVLKLKVDPLQPFTSSCSFLDLPFNTYEIYSSENIEINVDITMQSFCTANYSFQP